MALRWEDKLLKLARPQISMLMYFLYLDYPDFPKRSDEWVRKLLIKQGVYAVGKRALDNSFAYSHWTISAGPYC